MDNGTLTDAFTRYQQGRSLSPRTIARRKISIASFGRSIEPVTLLDATFDLIEEWLMLFASSATRRAYRSDLTALYTWATRRQMCAVNPVLFTDPVKVPKGLPRPVPPSHLPAILASAEPDVRVMIALAAYAGLRCAEISALEYTDLNLISDAPTLAVREGKGRKDRIVPVHPHLLPLLRGHKTGRVTRVNPQSVSVKVKAHLRSLGIDATCHQLRHSFGTELARTAEGNIVLVANLMGHGSVETSMRYIGWAGGPGQDAVGAMYPAA